MKYAHIFFLYITMFQLAGCYDEKAKLKASGLYDSCIPIDSNAAKLSVNGRFVSSIYQICENSIVETFDEQGLLLDERVYFFKKEYIKRQTIKDATSLWYNSPSTVRKVDTTYFSYVDSLGNVIIQSYSHLTNQLSEKAIVWSFDYGDDHSAPTIGINEDDKIVLIFSFHSSPLYAAVSTYPLDIFNFEVNEIESGYNTYPNLIYLGNNKFVVFFRKGFSGDSSKGEYHKVFSSDGGLTFTNSQKVIAFNNQYITYAFPKLLGKNIYMFFSNLNRETGVLEDLFYTYSLDDAKTWFSDSSFANNLNQNNAIKILSKKNIRIHSMAMLEEDVLVSYSIFNNEYTCCEVENKLYIYSLNENKSIEIGEGVVNYYSDGLVFDNNKPRIAYYFSNSKQPDETTLNFISIKSNPLRFNRLSSLDIEGKLGRITSLEHSQPGKLLWLEIEHYSSYKNYYTNYSLPEVLSR